MKILLSLIFLTTGWITSSSAWVFPDTLTNYDLISKDPSATVGDFSGGSMILLQDTLVFQGSNGIGSANLDLSDTKVVSTLPSKVTMINDLQSRTGYILATNTKDVVSSPDFVQYLVPFTIENGADYSNAVSLSDEIFLGYGSGLFFGHGYLFIAETESETGYRINIATGLVEVVDFPTYYWQSPSNWATFGTYEVAASSSQAEYVTYATHEGSLERQNAYNTDDFSNKLSNSTFGYTTSYLLDVDNNHWYVYYAGNGSFGASTSTLARANIYPISPTSQPSSSPTSQPSSQPTSSPTISIAAPKVLTVIIASSSPSNVKLSITLDANSRFGGTLYCKAFSDTTYNPVVSDIINGGISTSFSVDESILSVNISPLQPLTDYDVYCYTTNVLGYANSLADMRATKIRIQTPCCHSITFTNSPSVVYADLSKYSAGEPSSTYVFSFSLSTTPKQNVLIRPQLFQNDSIPVSSSVLSVTPSFFQFSSQSSTLEGSFIISAGTSGASFSKASLRLYLNSSGLGSVDYFSTYSNVSVLGSGANPPVPTLSVVRLGDGGQDMFLRFDSNTDYAYLSSTQSWNCSQLFQFLGSSSSSCVWHNASTVYVLFPSDTDHLVTTGSQVTLLGNKLRAACVSSDSVCQSSYLFASSASLSVAAPLNPVTPRVILRMPSSIGSCANLTIDAVGTTGSGGRSWKRVVWAVTQTSGGSSNLLSSLQAVLSSSGATLRTVVLISRTLLAPGEYVFSLQVTNFLDQATSTSQLLTVYADEYRPTVTIRGSTSVALFAKDALSVAASVSLPSCIVSSIASISRTWTLKLSSSNTVVNVTSLSTSSSRYTIAPYSLSPGNTYILSMNASVFMRSTGRYVSSAVTSVTVSVAQGSVYAIIRGGSAYTVSRESSVLLDGSLSYDEDASAATQQLLYSWVCSITSARNFAQDCSSIFNASTGSSASSVTVLGSALASNMTYSVRLQVRTSDNRLSTSSPVTLQSNSLPSLTTRIISSSLTNKVNFQELVTVNAFIQSPQSSVSNVLARWEAFVGNRNVSIPSLSPTTYVFDAATVASGALFSLVIDKNVFSPGTSITFRLSAGFVSASSSFSSANTYTEIVLVGNQAPQGGTLVCDPLIGNALSTDFSLSAIGFSDDVRDYPLTYIFAYRVAASRPFSVIQQSSQQASTKSKFPAGLQPNKYLITTFVLVTDIFKAQANISQTITVNSSLSSADLVSQSLELITTDETFLLSDEGMQLMSAVVSTLSSTDCSATSTSFCASRNRASCENTMNTCGACLTGYIGVFGDSNLRCVPQTSGTQRHRQLLGADVATASFVSDVSCTSDDDCLYGSCDNGMCSISDKSCTTSVSGSVCSGHGSCHFVDWSAKYVTSCGVNDATCLAKCQCDSGYGGESCELTSSELIARDSLRGLVCGNIATMLNLNDPSENLVQTIAALLHQSFSPYEVVTRSSLSACEDSLYELTLLSDAGYLSTTDPETATILLNSVSKLFVSSVQQHQNLSINSVHNIVDTVTSALLRNQNAWQFDSTYVSDHLRILIVKTRLENILNQVYSPPQTTEMIQYNVYSPSITFGEESIDILDSGNGYVKLAIASFGVNPFHQNVSSINGLHSSPLWITTGYRGATLSSVAAAAAAASAESTVDNRRLQTTASSNTTSSAAYYFTLPFLQAQRTLNMSFVIRNGVILPVNNETFPFCKTYDASINDYVSCSGCFPITYNAYNVTFACTSETELSSLSTTTESEESSSTDDYSLYARTFSTRQYAVSLEVYSDSNVQTIDITILSQNLFQLDYENAKVVIGLMGSMLIAFVLGTVMFVVWDEYDRKSIPESIFGADKKATKDGKSANRLGASERKSLVATRSIYFSEYQLKSLYRFMEDSRTKYDILRLTVPESLSKFSWYSLLSMLATNHPYISSFYKGSIGYSRSLSWFNLYRSLLLIVAVSTAIFYVFFPNDEYCESHASFDACTSRTNYATLQSTCEWIPYPSNANYGSCSLRLPPKTVKFRVLLALATALIVLPIDFITSFIVDEYCAKQPDISMLFRSKNSVKGKNNDDMLSSPAELAIAQALLEESEEKEAEEEKENDRTKDEKLADHSLSSDFSINITTSEQNTITKPGKSILESEKGTYASSPAKSVLKTRPPRKIYDSVFGSMMNMDANGKVEKEVLQLTDLDLLDEAENTHGKRKIQQTADRSASKYAIMLDEGVSKKPGHFYSSSMTIAEDKHDYESAGKLSLRTKMEILLAQHYTGDVFHSLEEETSDVMNKISTHFAQTNSIYTQLSPGELSAYEEMRRGRMEMIRKHFGIAFYAGQEYESLLVSLKKCFRQHRVMEKLQRARDEAENLSDIIDTLDANNANNKSTAEETAKLIDYTLLSTFILEQLPSMQRWILSSKLSCFGTMANEKVNLYTWLSAWLFTWLTIIVYIAWIFYWGLLNQRRLLVDWGWNIGIVVAQDMCFVHIVQGIVFYTLGVYTVAPYLRAIHRQLEHVAISIGDEGKLPLRKRLGEYLSYNLVQHLSPVARLARQLRRDRASSNNGDVEDIGMCQILEVIDDCDIVRCKNLFLSDASSNSFSFSREQSQAKESGLFNFSRSITFMMPFFLFVFGEQAATGIMQLLLILMSTGIVLGSVYLYAFQPLLLIVPYGAFLVWYLWQYHVRAWVKERLSVHAQHIHHQRFVYDTTDLHVLRAPKPATMSSSITGITVSGTAYTLHALSPKQLYHRLPWIRKQRLLLRVNQRWQKMCIPRPTLSSVMIATFVPSDFEEELDVDSPLLQNQQISAHDLFTAASRYTSQWHPVDEQGYNAQKLRSTKTMIDNHSRSNDNKSPVLRSSLSKTYSHYMSAANTDVVLSSAAVSSSPRRTKVPPLLATPAAAAAAASPRRGRSSSSSSISSTDSARSYQPIIPVEITELVKTTWQSKVSRRHQNHAKAVDAMLVKLHRDLFGIEDKYIESFALTQYRIGVDNHTLPLPTKNTPTVAVISRPRYSLRSHMYTHLVRSCTTVEDALYYMVEQYVLYHFPMRQDHDRLATKIFSGELHLSPSSLATILQSIWCVYLPAGRTISIAEQRKISKAFYEWSQTEKIPRTYMGQIQKEYGILFDRFEVWFQRILLDENILNTNDTTFATANTNAASAVVANRMSIIQDESGLMKSPLARLHSSKYALHTPINPASPASPLMQQQSFSQSQSLYGMNNYNQEDQRFLLLRPQSSFSLGGLNLQSFHHGRPAQRHRPSSPKNSNHDSSLSDMNQVQTALSRPGSGFLKAFTSPFTSHHDLAVQYLLETKKSQPSSTYDINNADIISSDNVAFSRENGDILQEYRKQMKEEQDLWNVVRHGASMDQQLSQLQQERGYYVRPGAVNHRLERLSSFHSSMYFSPFNRDEEEEEEEYDDNDDDDNNSDDDNSSRRVSTNSASMHSLTSNSSSKNIHRTGSLTRIPSARLSPRMSFLIKNNNQFSGGSAANAGGTALNSSSASHNANPLAARRGSAIAKSSPLVTHLNLDDYDYHANTPKSSSNLASDTGRRNSATNNLNNVNNSSLSGENPLAAMKRMSKNAANAASMNMRVDRNDAPNATNMSNPLRSVSALPPTTTPKSSSHSSSSSSSSSSNHNLGGSATINAGGGISSSAAAAQRRMSSLASSPMNTHANTTATTTNNNGDGSISISATANSVVSPRANNPLANTRRRSSVTAPTTPSTTASSNTSRF